MSTEILSDKNVLQRKATTVSKLRQYSDLDLSLTLHPDFKDIVPLLDIDAVKAAVKNLILTNFSERPFQPTVAGNIGGLLFEQADKFTAIMLRDSIKLVLAKHEPRVDSVNVSIQDNSPENRYDVTVSFRVISIDQPVDVSLRLQRVR